MNKTVLGLVFLMLFFFLPATANSQNISAEDKAVAIAANVMKKYKLSALPETCVSYMVADKNAAYFYVDARERHDKVCGGDPETAPLIAAMRIRRANGLVSILDAISGQYFSPGKYKAMTQQEYGD